jgi:hypothetical protein
MSSNGMPALMAALLTRMSRRPRRRRVSATRGAAVATWLTSPWMASAGCADAGDDLVRGGLAGDVVDGDGGALGGEAFGDGDADAARGAGDEGDLAGEAGGDGRGHGGGFRREVMGAGWPRHGAGWWQGGTPF